jgi:hypothetical protein
MVLPTEPVSRWDRSPIGSNPSAVDGMALTTTMAWAVSFGLPNPCDQRPMLNVLVAVTLSSTNRMPSS